MTPLGGDGAARGRRAPRRRARHAAPTASRPCSPSSPATCACSGPSRATSSTRARTSTPCSSRLRPPRPGRRARRCARSCTPASRTAARRSRGSLALAPAAAGRPRARARRAGASWACPADARAERLAPGRFARPARSGSRLTQPRALAPGKVNLCLFLGPPRADGLPRARLGRRSPSRWPTSSRSTPAPGRRSDEVVCPGVERREPRGAPRSPPTARPPAGTRRRCG